MKRRVRSSRNELLWTSLISACFMFLFFGVVIYSAVVNSKVEAAEPEEKPFAYVDGTVSADKEGVFVITKMEMSSTYNGTIAVSLYKVTAENNEYSICFSASEAQCETWKIGSRFDGHLFAVQKEDGETITESAFFTIDDVSFPVIDYQKIART